MITFREWQQALSEMAVFYARGGGLVYWKVGEYQILGPGIWNILDEHPDGITIGSLVSEIYDRGYIKKEGSKWIPIRKYMAELHKQGEGARFKYAVDEPLKKQLQSARNQAPWRGWIQAGDVWKLIDEGPPSAAEYRKDSESEAIPYLRELAKDLESDDPEAAKTVRGQIPVEREFSGGSVMDLLRKRVPLTEMAHAVAWPGDESEARAFSVIRGFPVVHPTFLWVIHNRDVNLYPEGIPAKEIARAVLFQSRLLKEKDSREEIPGEAGVVHHKKIWGDTNERNKWARDVRAQLKQKSSGGKWSNLLHFEVVPGSKPELFRLTPEAEERVGGLKRTGVKRTPTEILASQEEIEEKGIAHRELRKKPEDIGPEDVELGAAEF